jgi:hypothetical protein
VLGWSRAKLGLALPDKPFYFEKHQADVMFTLLKVLLYLVDTGEQRLEGTPFRRRCAVVDITELADLGQRQSEALAAQYQPAPGVITGMVNAYASAALGRDQTLSLVQSQGTRRDPELIRQGANCPGSVLQSRVQSLRSLFQM